MGKAVLYIGSLACFLALSGVVTMAEGQMVSIENAEVLKAAKDQLKERTLQSGTLDVYDAAINKVRNLKKIEFQDVVAENDNGYSVLGDYRDIVSGEIVTVEAFLSLEEGSFVIDSVRIKNVMSASQEDADREYNDQEIRDFMLDYVEKQGKFNDGKVMLFDKDAGKMRNLKLRELKTEVRRMGIFYSSSSAFIDVDTQDILDIDIAVEKKNGKLNIQALRIRDVKKSPGGDGAAQ